MALIEINNLVKKFPVGKGFFTALNDVNLTFGRGEFTGFVGPSGSAIFQAIFILVIELRL